jgi:ribosome-associated toxin RatA of RatAB toxin-antitoxin module
VPEVKIDLEIRAPIERVWETVIDIERYQDSMDTVRSVRIVGQDDERRRRAAWSVLLKGSILEWEEEEELDPEAHTVSFKQLRGDLEHFDGHWALEAIGPEQTKVVFEVVFEIGIPMLAEMLNPVAQRSLQENCTEMLRGIERTAAIG